MRIKSVEHYETCTHFTQTMTELVRVSLGYDGHYPHQTLQTGTTDGLGPVPLPFLIGSLVFCVVSDEYSTKEEKTIIFIYTVHVPKYCNCKSMKVQT